MQDINVGDKVVCIVNNDETLAPCEICEVEEFYGNNHVKVKGYSKVFKIDIFRKY